MVSEDFSVFKTLLEVCAVFFAVYTIGGLGLMLLKVIVNWIGVGISIILETTWGKLVALVLIVWLVVFVFQQG